MVNILIDLDVHKRSVYATVMNDNGDIIIQRNMENNMETVNKFLSDYKNHDIVIESSTSGKYLCKELLKLNYKIHLINPSKVPEIYNNYKKTDKEDSFQLADVFRKGGMKEIYIPSEEIENIRSLVRYRHSLGEELTLKKNKIHALLTSYGIIIKATDPFGKKGLKEIESNYNNLNYSDGIVLRSLLNDSIIILYFSSPVHILPGIYITSFIYLYKLFVIYISLAVFKFKLSITSTQKYPITITYFSKE